MSIIKIKKEYNKQRKQTNLKQTERGRKISLSKEKRKVVRIDPFTGETKEYESINSVKIDGFEHKNVFACCKKMRKSHGGFYWKFVEDEI